MAIVVQKYGGTSLADAACVRRCAERAAAAHRDGHQVVVVVSAMGGHTDELIRLANAVSDAPDRRELDVLLSTGEQASSALMTMALHHLGVEAISLSGPKLGIVTDPTHTRARIRSIDAKQLRERLERGTVVVAAGFQGVSIEGETTTLGRGGSDTTAVGLAAALKQSYGGGGTPDATWSPRPDVRCEIYTDVDGVYTADPRMVPGARRLDRISCEEMMELASLGAGVMHGRAVMFGHKFGVPIQVRHSAATADAPSTGTLIVSETPDMEASVVIGCALTTDLARFTLRGLPNQPGSEATLFRHLADADVLVDDIMQIESAQHADLSFTVASGELRSATAAVERGVAELEVAAELNVEQGMAKVSAVGVGMRTHTGVAARMFQALSEAGITIANITTSEIKISCIVPARDGERALRAAHDAFGLSEASGGGDAMSSKAKVVPAI